MAKGEMAKIFITGSADGLGHLAAKALIGLGHEVVLHARNVERGREAIRNAPGAKTVVTGDLSDFEETKHLAQEVNALGVFDAEVHSNAVDPGWVPTKMGGRGAPDDLQKGYETQVWLAVSDEPAARVSGCYFHHKRQVRYLPAAGDVSVQEKFLAQCEQITGVRFGGE